MIAPFIFNNVDTLEGAPILPVYLTESISDYYYQRSPIKRREVFKGSKVLAEAVSVGALVAIIDLLQERTAQLSSLTQNWEMVGAFSSNSKNVTFPLSTATHPPC